mmetsp:Transcript_10900/g.25414  ORF Transcript_10900/g.25414 Transcript_10900/m.25414 type:complete len:124 (-) Transcript_10900:1035-1406(-)
MDSSTATNFLDGTKTIENPNILCAPLAQRDDAVIAASPGHCRCTRVTSALFDNNAVLIKSKDIEKQAVPIRLQKLISCEQQRIAIDSIFVFRNNETSRPTTKPQYQPCNFRTQYHFWPSHWYR